MARSSGLRSPLAAAARRLLIAVLFIATVTFGSSQLITEAAVGQVAPQPVLVETMPVGLPAVAARAVSADASGTTGMVGDILEHALDVLLMVLSLPPASCAGSWGLLLIHAYSAAGT